MLKRWLLNLMAASAYILIAGFCGTIPASAQTAASSKPVRIPVHEFSDAVRERMEKAEGDGLWVKYFRITEDKEKFLRTVRDWLNGVVVDPTHLGTGSDADMGLTQNKGLGAFTRIWRDEESYEYLGHIILRSFNASNRESSATMFHEAIHAYSYATSAGDLDNDDFNGPEFLSAAFIDEMVPFLNEHERRMENTIAAIRRCEPNATYGIADWMTEYDKRRFQFYNFQYNKVIGDLVKHLGGSLDWDGYQKEVNNHVQAIIETTDCAATGNIEDRLKDLRGEVEAFQQRVQEDNDLVARATAARASIEAARAKYLNAWILFVRSVDGTLPEIDALQKTSITWFSGPDRRSNEVLMAAAWVNLAARRLDQAYSMAERATNHAEETRGVICAWSSESKQSTDVLQQRQREAEKRVVISAGAVGSAFERVKADREALVHVAQELRPVAQEAEAGGRAFRILAGKSHSRALDEITRLADEFDSIVKNAFAAAGMQPDALRNRTLSTSMQGSKIDRQIGRLRDLRLKPDEIERLDEIERAFRSAWGSHQILPHEYDAWWLRPSLDPSRLADATRFELSAQHREALAFLERAPEIAAKFEHLVQVANEVIGQARDAAGGALIDSLASEVALEEAKKCADVLLAMKPGVDTEDPNALITVPDVRGIKIEKALGILRHAGIQANAELAGETKDPALIDTVTSQSPGPGEKVKKEGASVSLRVLIGAVGSGNVPSVVGKKLNTAVAAIEAAGLVPVIQVGADTTDTSREGTISWQGPQAGDMVPLGSDVVIEVYAAVTPGRIVPSLVGLNLSRAGSVVHSRDLFLDRVIESDAPSIRDEGRILRQYPEPGLEIPQGTAVRVWAYGDYTPPPPTPDPPAFSDPFPSSPGIAGSYNDPGPYEEEPFGDKPARKDNYDCIGAYRQILMLKKSGANFDSMLLMNEAYDHCDYMEMTMVLSGFESAQRSGEDPDVDEFLGSIGKMTGGGDNTGSGESGCTPGRTIAEQVINQALGCPNTGGSGGTDGQSPSKKCRGRGVCRDCGDMVYMPTSCMDAIKADIEKKCGGTNHNYDKKYFACQKEVTSYWVDFYE